jgi:glutamate racemase
MKNNNAPIGVFDSGLGGLTVVSAITKRMPRENIVYLGDTARVPYGDKSRETIIKFGIENAAFLQKQQVKMIIIACNTVSALAIDEIRTEFSNIPIIGVLEAGVNIIIEKQPTSVSIIGTRATINSNAYYCEIRKSLENIEITSIPCPLFAPIIEEGLANHKIGTQAIDLYLNNLKKTPTETLLLGCTHYPLIKNALKNYLPKSIKIIDSATAVAKLAEKKLHEYSLINQTKSATKEKYYVTDLPQTFTKHAEQFLGKKLQYINKISI